MFPLIKFKVCVNV